MLAFAPFRALSTLEEEVDRLRLDAWFVLMLPLTRLSALSTLDEELESDKLEV
jgi:hypothetical protein